VFTIVSYADRTIVTAEVWIVSDTKGGASVNISQSEELSVGPDPCAVDFSLNDQARMAVF